MIRYPNITGKTEVQKLEQMSSYLHQLADELNYQLEKGGSAQNGNLQTARATAAAIAKPVKNDSAISSFNEIKALIIKSADIVKAYSDSIKETLKGEYVAVSDFGTYTEETLAELDISSDRISSALDKYEKIDGEMGELEKRMRSEIEQTAESIKLEVTDDTAGKTASIKLSVGEGDDKKEYTGTIDMTGLVTFTNLTDGKTEISGDNITTGKILAEFIDVLNLVVGKLYAQNPSGSGITLDENGLQRSSADQTNPIIHLKHDWIQTGGFLEEKPYFDMFNTFFDRDVEHGNLVGGITEGVHIDADGIEFRSDISNFVDYPVHSYDHTVDFGINRYGEVTGRLKVDAPTDDDHVVNKEYVDGEITKAKNGAMALRPVQIEFAGSSGHGGYIDFHHGKSTADYTSRIIEAASGTLDINQVSMSGGDLGAKNINLRGVDTPTINFGSSAATINLAGTSNQLHIKSKGNMLLYPASANGTYFALLGNSMYHSTDNAVSCGASTKRWSTVYAGTGTINTSDRNEKENIQDIDEKYIRLFEKLRPVTYEFIGGNHDRIHIGYISQEVKDAMDEVGLTDLDFAGYCRDKKTEDVLDESGALVGQKDVLDENGKPVYQYALRYAEFIALNTKMIQLQQKTIQEQQEKIEAMEKEMRELKETVLSALRKHNIDI